MCPKPMSGSNLFEFAVIDAGFCDAMNKSARYCCHDAKTTGDSVGDSTAF